MDEVTQQPLTILFSVYFVHSISYVTYDSNYLIILLQKFGVISPYQQFTKDLLDIPVKPGTIEFISVRIPKELKFSVSRINDFLVNEASFFYENFILKCKSLWVDNLFRFKGYLIRLDVPNGFFY